jgi:hypothetical protein
MFFVTIGCRWKLKLSTAVDNYSIQSRDFLNSPRWLLHNQVSTGRLHPAGVDLEAAELN